jgi:predicted acylesterase/phospholipase RssA
MYELGAIAAVDEWLRRERLGSVNEFDIYVGTSAGAFVATILAAGMPAQVAYRAVLDEDPSMMPARRTDIYRFDARQGLGIALDLAAVLGSAVKRTMRERRLMPFGELAGDLLDALPAGIFSLRHYERYLDRFLRHHGLPVRFGDVPRRLFITANDLDSGHRAVFGEGELSDVPLATAICASSAIPLFFEPVRWQGRDFVDGAVGKIAHADLALRRGASLVVIVNPLVPYRHDPQKGSVPTPVRSVLRQARHIRDKGLLGVFSQASKMSTRTKLHQGIRRYQAAWPDARLLLVEPRDEEADHFLRNPMSMESRRAMLEYGHRSTVSLLEREGAAWRAAFARELATASHAATGNARGA